MIKAANKSHAGVPLLFLGLSGENVTRLASGEPIKVSASDMRNLGLPELDVILHYGRTEQDIIAELEALGIKWKRVLK